MFFRTSMTLFLAIPIELFLFSGSASAQGKTITLEVWVPPNTRLFVEGQETRATGAMRLFVSPPLAEGKYVYTLKAIIPGPKGPNVVVRKVQVQPGDFEMVDFRDHGKKRIPDCRYEPTPQNAVDALLKLARVTKKDVVWDLGCGDGRIPVTAARDYGCKARGYDLDPARIKDSLANVKKNQVGKLVSIERKDIFTLDLSKEPTLVTLYLLPHLNLKLLPQLTKLPPGARVVSVAHRMGDIKPDRQITVDTEEGEFPIYLWKVETLRKAGK